MRARANLKAIFGVAALLETGLFMSSAGAATFVYVGNADSQDVSVLELKSNGDLAPVETAAVPGPTKPGGSLPLAVSPDKKRLFVGLRNEPYTVGDLHDRCQDRQADATAAPVRWPIPWRTSPPTGAESFC